MQVLPNTLAAVFASLPLIAGADPAGFVDPFIGTAGSANTYPGAAVPHGLVALSPDTRETGWNSCGGYHRDDTSILGFSHTHISGTGVEELADVLLMPGVGPLQFSPGPADNPDAGYRSRFSHASEKASPGYYSVMLDDCKVKAELTATARTGMHRYTFPASDDSHFIIDLDHGLDRTRRYGRSETLLDNAIRFENDRTISGYRHSTGWINIQELYFVMEFSRPFDGFGVEEKGKAVPGFTGKTGSNGASMPTLRGYVRFRTKQGEQILVRCGISTVSIENARANLRAEAATWDFDQVAAQARAKWNDVLGSIEFDGDERQKRIFHTALYHAHLAPNNIADSNGQYIGPDHRPATSPTGAYYSTLSLWDTYRTLHPLYTILHPQLSADIVKSMLDHFDRTGVLPVWPLWGKETWTMIGNHAIPVIADAHGKGLLDKETTERAWKAVRESSMKDHNNLPFSDWEKFGYLPFDHHDNAVSKTLEICYNDWCVYRMAKALGKTGDAEHFRQRALRYRNLFDPATGFMRGKDSAGQWREPFDPAQLTHGTDYTEGNAWQYSWYVPHDVAGMIRLFGSRDAFIAKLDALFTTKVEKTSEILDVSGFIGQYAHGNEPSHHIAWLYHYAGQPWKGTDRVRQILDSLYNDTPDGICGNEDCGQMSAWYVMSAMGLYPVNPADGIYQIGSPLAPRSAFRPVGGRGFEILAPGVSRENRYIQSATLNGKPWTKNFLPHSEIIKGGKLELVLGPKPSAWGTKPEDCPPSMTSP